MALPQGRHPAQARLHVAYVGNAEGAILELAGKHKEDPER